MADNNNTTEQVDKEPPNPTGKGGFGDHPENRNPGGWRKEVSFSYQYKRFMAMSINELETYAHIPKDKRLVVEDLAYARVMDARKSLNDVKEITDRTEGKAPQFFGFGGDDEYKKLLVEFIGDEPNDNVSES